MLRMLWDEKKAVLVWNYFLSNEYKEILTPSLWIAIHSPAPATLVVIIGTQQCNNDSEIQESSEKKQSIIKDWAWFSLWVNCMPTWKRLHYRYFLPSKHKSIVMRLPESRQFEDPVNFLQLLLPVLPSCSLPVAL